MPNRFNHYLSTIELTKLLERIGCETLSSTMYLGHDFLSGAVQAVPQIERISTGGGGAVLIEEILDAPMTLGPLGEPYRPPIIRVVFTPPSAMQSEIWQITASFTRPTSGTVNVPLDVQIQGNTRTITPINADILDVPATYTLGISIRVSGSFGPVGAPTGYVRQINMTFVFSAAVNRNAKAPASISDVLNRILDVVPVRRRGIDERRFVLDPYWEERLSKIAAGEYFAPQKNLYEHLKIAVSKAHLIPRLKWCEETNSPRIITFDVLGGNVHRTVTVRHATYEAETDIDDYCGAIDSTVENVVDTVSDDHGTITEPAAGGFKTLRAPDGEQEIIDDNACLTTDYPIYQIKKLTMGWINANTFVGDITPYVYEQAEYSALQAGIESTFPFSKQYALVYKQGDNKITGFATRANESAAGIGVITSMFRRTPVIQNIINRVLGRPQNTSIPAYKNLAFQIEYIPIAGARVIQKKVHLLKFPNDNTLIYNQGASTVEAQNYGENLKGVAARIGNTIERKTYYFKKYSDIPKIGELVDGMYVSNVAKQYELGYIKATITLAKNFNDLHRYLGIQSNYRAYDVSERQAYTRRIVYSEDVIIGDRVPDNVFGLNGNETSPMISGPGSDFSPHIDTTGISAFSEVFVDNTRYDNAQVKVADVACTTNDITTSRVFLPVISQSYGNTMSFTFRMKDNFSAGNESRHIGDRRNENLAVPYGDVYGEVEELTIFMGNNAGDRLTGFSQAQTTGASPDAGGAALPRIIDPIFISDTGEPWPSISNPIFRLGWRHTGGNGLIVRKDSREHLDVSLQLSMRANRDGIVIGSALCRLNPLIYGASRKVGVYVLPYKLNKLDGRVDLSVSQKLLSAFPGEIEDGIVRMAVGWNNIQIAQYSFKRPPNFEPASIAIVNEIVDSDNQIRSGELFVGDNNLNASSPIADYVSNPIHITFTDNMNVRRYLDDSKV